MTAHHRMLQLYAARSYSVGAHRAAKHAAASLPLLPPSLPLSPAAPVAAAYCSRASAHIFRSSSSGIVMLEGMEWFFRRDAVAVAGIRVWNTEYIVSSVFSGRPP